MVVPASDPVFLINTQMSTRGGCGTTWKRLQLQNFSHARQWNSTCCCACRWPQRTRWGRYSGGGFAWNTKNLIYSDHHCCTSRLCWELVYLYNSLVRIHLNRSQHFATREDTLVLLNHVFTDMTEACLFDLKIEVWLQGEKPIAIHHLSKIEFWNPCNLVIFWWATLPMSGFGSDQSVAWDPPRRSHDALGGRIHEVRFHG
jgi:hypothetical protein